MADLSASDGYNPRISACPACDAAPLAARVAGRAPAAPSDLILSLPGVHCAQCITDVERALLAVPGVRQARVNLTLRRALIDAPGLSAEDLIPVIERTGYEAHELDPSVLSSSAADRQGRDILMRIGVSGFAMMNVMILSIAVWSGAEGATRDMFHWLGGLIAIPTVLFAGQPFFKGAWRSLRNGRLGMDVPISLALILTTAISLYETANSGPHAYFDGVVMLCFFLLIGRYLDYRTRAVARSAAEELTALELPRATLLRDGVEEIVAVADLRPGNMIRVRPGARLPADAQVVAGMSEIDRSLLTGESLPVQARPGTALSAGEVNLTGPLDLRVTAAGRDSSLSRLADLVAAAEATRGRYASLADRASSLYSPVVHLLAFFSFLGWMYVTAGDWRVSVNVAAAVLIITCPCALGLAVPAVVTAASGKLFGRGLLIKDGTALERMAQIDTVVFDKTGTLTLGTPELETLAALPGPLRPVALAIAQGSNHPLSRALAAALDDAGVAPARLEHVREVPGYGVEAQWNGAQVRLGRADWVGVATGEDAPDGPLSVLSVDGHAPVVLRFADALRPGAVETVAALRKSGRRVVMLSGDGPGAVARAAAVLGITEYRAGVSPAEKAAEIAALRDAGAHVLMVGDGLNDTAALAGAHVSISPATALDAARVASDIVLMGRDLRPVAEALSVARVATRRIRENFVISGAYNVVAVPIAILGFATPLLAALAMSISSITVTLNALRLKGDE